MGSQPPEGNSASPFRRRDYYPSVWKAATKKTNERVVKKSALTLVTATITGGIGLTLGWVVGPAYLSIPVASDAVEKAVLAFGGTAVFLFGQWVVVHAWELVSAPVTMLQEEQEKGRRLATERDEAQQQRASEPARPLHYNAGLMTSLAPGLQFFVDDPNEEPYMENDLLTPDQTIIRVGLRTRGINTVRGVTVRIVRTLSSDGSSPRPDFDREAILNVMGGTPLSGRDLNDGDELFPQLLTVRNRAGRALPDVKVNYALGVLNDAYPALPTGEWLLMLRATGEGGARAERLFSLRITDNPDRRKRAVLRMEADHEDEV